MHQLLTLAKQQEQDALTLQRSFAEPVQLVGSAKLEDVQPPMGTDLRLMAALQAQQKAWMSTLGDECELVGALTGAGGVWPSAHAKQCEVDQLQARLRRVRETQQSILKLPDARRLLEQNICLQGLSVLPRTPAVP
jgi:uncharacterized protein YecT (DUF1311 family)